MAYEKQINRKRFIVRNLALVFQSLFLTAFLRVILFIQKLIVEIQNRIK